MIVAKVEFVAACLVHEVAFRHSVPIGPSPFATALFIFYHGEVTLIMVTPAFAGSSVLQATQALGQSLWLDNISRSLITSGNLARLITNDGLQGMTSNPSIFDKAFSESDEYDVDIRRMARSGAGTQEIYDALTIADIQAALDLFRPVYDADRGHDGYVSLEVSPLLARDSSETLSEARRLWNALARPNAMIKIPGTEEGLPAIEEALFEGINVNVTLLFSVDAYEKVAQAHIRALKRRHEAGMALGHVASVASFFVSRIDSAVDSWLEKNKPEAKALLGKIAIANAKNAYGVYEKLYKNADFAKLAEAGARPQRLLWASTGTKNPAYPDTLYVDELIGPETVNTVPPATYEAFRDHGKAAPRLLEGRDNAMAELKSLKDSGLNLSEVTDSLLDDGIKQFVKAFEKLMAGLDKKRSEFAAGN
jgi:transaldolase